MHISENLKKEINELVSKAIKEDIGQCDLTASLCGDLNCKAIINNREKMILAGQAWVDELYRQIDPEIKVNWFYKDGDSIKENSIISEIKGSKNNILSGERCALNFLQTISSTATTTKKYVEKIRNTDCKILDTRKTIPGLRLSQKYAVTCGGGTNHRFGLYDAILIKENHIINSKGIKYLIKESKKRYPGTPTEVEVESLDEAKIAISAGANRLLLDNFTLGMLSETCKINQEIGTPPALIEASGNITIDNVKETAATGVDFVSIGAITKNIAAIDLSMLIKD
ncbi:MAG: carboxylating nicotinate-nucleotide diphosphorylase [Pseudomonadota bacterium]|nr:carboxylating nicotinate-nucleotide diphosphorylase [Pseudomonadota bacterium]